MYLARLDAASNDPAECHTSWGDPTPCDPKLDIPAARRNYVGKEPDATKVLMGEMMMYWHGAGGAARRWRVNHQATYLPVDSAGVVPFEGMNMGYGDGHVEWRSQARFPKIFKNDLNPLDAATRRTANLIRDNDMWWW
jgi:prepilin-type processing-associated H-X9-DG protein